MTYLKTPSHSNLLGLCWGRRFIGIASSHGLIVGGVRGLCYKDDLNIDARVYSKVLILAISLSRISWPLCVDSCAFCFPL